MNMRHALLVAALIMGAPAWAINKCKNPDGKTVFQDAPCSGQGEKIEVRPASGYAVRAPASAASAPVSSAATPPLASPSPAPIAPPAVPVKSALETSADTCLAWYKPFLRDPASAYYSGHKFEDSRVLRMDLHAKNGYGGVQIMKAVCEFENGRFNEGWTKLQAERIGWKVN
jgi:hypothetical protein